MKKIYIIKTGSLHPITNSYWFSDYYYTSKKKALLAAQNIIDVNRAKDVSINPGFNGYKDIQNIEYRSLIINDKGEKYVKAKILIGWDYIN